MKKQFVTYEIALKLKELGFNEECIGYKTKNDHFSLKLKTTNSNLNKQVVDYQNKYKGILPEMVASPLWQQAIDWLREEHKLHVAVLPFRNVEVGDEIVLCFYYTLTNLDGNLSIFLNADTLYASVENFDTPDLAREKSILKAIEIVKKRQEEEKGLTLSIGGKKITTIPESSFLKEE